MLLYFPNVYIQHVLGNLGFAIDHDGYLVPPLPSLLVLLSNVCIVILNQPSREIIPVLKKTLMVQWLQDCYNAAAIHMEINLFRSTDLLWCSCL